jgi:hypothetical protein
VLHRRKPKREPLIDTSELAFPKVVRRVRKPGTIFRSSVHRSWIAGLPCLGCGRIPPERATPDNQRNEAAHLWMGTGHYTKGRKPPDYFCWPGCHRCHQKRQHIIGEPAFFLELGIYDPARYVLEQYALRSPCQRTVAAAREVWDERYA